MSYVSFAEDEDNIVYDDGGRRDPFIALVTPDGRLLNLEPADSEEKIVLEGIITGVDGHSYAVINGEVVTIGDYIHSYVVSKIEENRIILIKDNNPVEYKLSEEEP